MAEHLGDVLDDSNVERTDNHGYTGAVVEHARLAGAHVSRIMHPPGQRIDAHAHDWPVLSLFRIGGYREVGERGEASFDGPSIVFQPPRTAHADEIGASGLETLAMTFDPAWLAADARAAMPLHTCWLSGGPLSAHSRRLAELWLSPQTSEQALQSATSRFLFAVFSARATAPPAWVSDVERWLGDEAPTSLMARRVQRHRASLARAYRFWRGEGLGETLRRHRIERATLRLRTTAAPLAEIAAECGFCDQSHMNRCFRAVLGRTPLEVRREAPLLAGLA